MRKAAVWIIGLGLAGFAAGLFITRPRPLAPDSFAQITGRQDQGAVIFAASGCASCHAAPGATDDARLTLAGGKAFASDFGTFYAPNISTDPENGIGAWTDLEIASALMRGVSRDGKHLYPALPYAAYNKATPQDIADLIAYLRTLPADPTPSRAHDVGFPFNIRASLGGWKFLFNQTEFVMTDPATPQIERGRYLVEALGHCAECHTPRNALGGLKRDEWLAGAAIPGGTGRTPDLRPGKLTWSESEIVEYLTSGFTPDFDTAGGEMAEVVKNTAQLPQADREAIAAYLKAVPAAL